MTTNFATRGLKKKQKQKQKKKTTIYSKLQENARYF
jgi:hypothetical protein